MPTRGVVPILILVLVALLTAPEAVRAQPTPNGDAPPLKSEDHALKLSLLGTGVPIAVGALITLVGVSHSTYVDASTGMTYESRHRWGTGAGLALTGAGVILGPTLGYVYAGGVGGLPIRLLLPVAGAAVAIAPAGSCSGEDCGIGVLATGFAVGCGLSLLDSAYDILRLKATVRKRNERSLHSGVRLVPGHLTSAEGPALAVQVAF